MSTLADIQAKLAEELRYVDDVAQIVLKGHLVMEELMNDALSTFLLHKEFLESARLQFSQKLSLCRGVSTSEHENSMWNLIAGVNTLRNHLSHSLNSDERSRRIASLGAMCAQEFPEHLPESIEEMSREAAICVLAIAHCLGFLHAFLEEVQRLKGLIVNLDGIMNEGRLGQA